MRRTPINRLVTARQCAAVLKAMGDDRRLRILESLLLGERCVSELTRTLRCRNRTRLITCEFFAKPDWWRDIDAANRSVIVSRLPSSSRWRIGKGMPWISAAVSCVSPQRH